MSASSFSEHNDTANPKSLKNPDGSPHPMAGKKDVVWIARDKSRPLFSFAGIWTGWEGARGTKANPIEGKHLIYAFLTCEPNAIVAPVHAKAIHHVINPNNVLGTHNPQSAGRLTVFLRKRQQIFMVTEKESARSPRLLSLRRRDESYRSAVHQRGVSANCPPLATTFASRWDLLGRSS